MDNTDIISGIVVSPDFGGTTFKVSKRVDFVPPLAGGDVHVMIALSGIESENVANPSVNVSATRITRNGFTAVFDIKSQGHRFLTAQYTAFAETR